MAADNSGAHLLGAMDTLWFHQTILFSEQSLLLSPEIPKIPKIPLPTSESSSPRNSSQVYVTTFSQDETSNSQETTDHDKGTRTKIKERRTRLNNLVSSKTRFHSSPPFSAYKQSRLSRKLLKSTSSKSLGKLELQEVKGFMDLGFVFEKDNLSKQMMSLIPGLQRIDTCLDNSGLIANDAIDNVEDEDDGDYEMKTGIMRPYLSEAWDVRRADFPLLNLRIARVSTAEDMKKHLKHWARAVASAVQQES